MAHEDRRLKGLARCYRLAALLAEGEALDRNRVAAELGITPANADRHVRAIRETMQVTASTGKDGRTVIRAVQSGVLKPNPATVVAACFGASLARLFQHTPYEARLRDIVGHVLEPVRGVRKFEHRERQFLFVAGGGERALRKNGGAILDTIVDAILGCNLLRVKHTSFKGKEQTLRVKPLSLALHEHQLYLLAHREEDDELRVLRFSRIATALKLKQTFEYPSLDKYDPGLVFRDSIGIFIGDDDEIRVRDVKIKLSPRWAGYAETHQWHESQHLEIVADGVILKFHVRTCPELQRLILGFGADAEVIEPIELRERISGQVNSMAARYGLRRARRRPTRSKSRRG